MRRGQRQDDGVFRRRRLQFEIEFAAEALAQGQAPGAVDAAAERGVDDKLHAARLVEEALEHDGVLRGQSAQRRERGGEMIAQLSAAGAPTPISREARAKRLRRRDRIAGSLRFRVRRRETERESMSVRPGASPSQKGMLGGWPWASSTRTVPRSTRWMR